MGFLHVTVLLTMFGLAPVILEFVSDVANLADNGTYSDSSNCTNSGFVPSEDNANVTERLLFRIRRHEHKDINVTFANFGDYSKNCSRPVGCSTHHCHNSTASVNVTLPCSSANDSNTGQSVSCKRRHGHDSIGATNMEPSEPPENYMPHLYNSSASADVASNATRYERSLIRHRKSTNYTGFEYFKYCSSGNISRPIDWTPLAQTNNVTSRRRRSIHPWDMDKFSRILKNAPGKLLF